MMYIILSTIPSLLLNNTSGLTVKWSLVRAFMMARSCFKRVEQLPTPTTVVVTKSPSPEQGLIHSAFPGENHEGTFCLHPHAS